MGKKKQNPREKQAREPGKSRSGWIAGAVPILTALVALYAAALSTFIAINDRAEKARRLDITIAYGRLASGQRMLPPGLAIRVVNPGYQPVIVTAGGFVLPNGELYYILPGPVPGLTAGETTGFPHTINPNDNFSVYLVGKDLQVVCDDLEKKGVKGTCTLSGFVFDGAERKYVGERFTFDLAEARRVASEGAVPSTAASPGGIDSDQ